MSVLLVGMINNVSVDLYLMYVVQYNIRIGRCLI